MAALCHLLRSSPFSFASADIPDRPGVYVICDVTGRPYYIGQSRNLRRRLLVDHRKGNGKSNVFRRKLARIKRFDSEPATTAYIMENCTVRLLEIDSEWGRLEMEHFATAILSPVLNAPAGWYNRAILLREVDQCSPNVSSPVLTSTAVAL